MEIKVQTPILPIVNYLQVDYFVWMRSILSRCFGFLLCLGLLQACSDEPTGPDSTPDPEPPVVEAFYPSAKPCTRWWWFATEIKKPDVKYQLDWAKENNFGDKGE